jgi:hypothetical protein
MKKKAGFSSFEFYFVMVVIGLIMLIGLQRYLQMAEDVKRFSFEVLARHFNTSVYNFHTQWFLAKAKGEPKNPITLEGVDVQFSDTGWPLSVQKNGVILSSTSITSCYQLWMTLLQNPQPISFDGGDAYGSRAYHLSLSPEGFCRYQLVTDIKDEYYFDYSSMTGQIIIHTPVINQINSQKQ